MSDEHLLLKTDLTKVIEHVGNLLDSIERGLKEKIENHECVTIKTEKQMKYFDCGKFYGMQKVINDMRILNNQILNKKESL